MSDEHSTDWLDQPKNQRLIRVSLYVACAILVVVDFFVHRHIMFAIEKIPAFYALFGFVACVVLVWIATWMRKFLMRDEDYYDVEP
ncbi:hypothetical protein F3N42_13210 [Marinihelvus fidelis]|uniref:Uncharacterized protein n=1 Tax=Marinihelvus fidelis TaxID=2613842 RepID=A0A5N0T650_9GAMM|nr:hypothetical protein [Marinihelvus fidelis]KAA9130291.1 hypothetical protein F3N42_13210 [Marinihelvus fidelis]